MITPKAIISDNFDFFAFAINIKCNHLYYNNKINYRIYIKVLSIYMFVYHRHFNRKYNYITSSALLAVVLIHTLREYDVYNNSEKTSIF